MYDLLQTWKAINDKHNSGTARPIPPAEWEKWMSFKKTDKCNKVIRDDVKQACLQLDAAFVKGKAWLRKPQWLEVFGRLKAMSNALEKLQVRVFICCLKFALRHCFFTTDD